MDGDPCKIGIMHPAFRVGKVKLMAWVNEFLETDYEKVEHCADGAVYVQLCDSIFGLKESQMRKVKWGSRSKTDWSDNWKIVQAVFNKNDISKPIDVGKITNGKFQDNLEVMQWFKHFHECKFNKSNNYEAKKRRALSKSGSKKSKKAKLRSVTRKKNATSSPSERKTNNKGRKKLKDSGDNDKVNKLQKLIEDVGKATVTIEAVEKERNFYFGKLREIEILCQEEEQQGGEQKTNSEEEQKKIAKLQEDVLAIMYKTDEGGDMVAPLSENEDGNQESIEEASLETF